MKTNKITKDMLSLIREFNNPRHLDEVPTKLYLYEQESVEDTDDVTNINDVDVRVISDDPTMRNLDNQKDELENLIDSFRTQVSQIATLNPGITIKDNQIRLDGQVEDNNLKFVFIGGEESGIYISADMVELDADTIHLIDKLHKFINFFKDITEPMIRERKGN